MRQGRLCLAWVRCLSSTRQSGSARASTAVGAAATQPASPPVSKEAAVAKEASRTPPPSTFDPEYRHILGTVKLPSVFKDRMVSLLRKETTRGRLGIEKFVDKYQQKQDLNDRGKRDFPFIRGEIIGHDADPDEARFQAMAFLAEWLPSIYSSAFRTFIEIQKRLPGFEPQRLLNYGAGVGADVIAAKTVWPAASCLPTMSAVEDIEPLTRIGKALTQDLPGLEWSARLAAHQDGKSLASDLVCASFAMGGETAGDSARLVRELWARCSGVLVLTEAGTPKGFERIAQARRLLLRDGDCVILAPCAHARECPMAAASAAAAGGASGAQRQWCHFSQRHAAPSFQRLARDGFTARDYLDWKFSYLIVARRGLVADGWPELARADGVPNWGRLYRPPMKRGGHVVMDLCTADGALERRIVAKSHGEAGGYRLARDSEWGDAFPYGPAKDH